MVALGVTMSTLVEHTRDLLTGPRRVPRNKLAEAIEADDAFLMFAHDAAQVKEGAFLAIEDEVVYVWAVEGQRADIERGQRGTTAAHHEDGAVVEVEPRFPAGVILRALAQEIRSWPEDVYSVEILTAALGRTQDAITLAVTGDAEVHRLLQVDFAADDSHDDWWPYTGAVLRRSSGYILAFGHEVGIDTEVRVHLARSFDVDTLTSSTDVGDVGLALSMLDIPPLGAAASLVGYTEAERTDSHARASSATTDAVRPGHRLTTGRALREQRDDRLNDERRRLLSRYGYGLALV